MTVRRIGAPFVRPSEAVVFTANERLLLNLIRTEDRISRADLARKTGLTVQSVVRLVDGLVARGFLVVGEKMQLGGPGQPSVSIRLATDAAFTLGVSIMTDAVSLVVADWTGRVRASAFDRVDVADRPATLEHLKSRLATLAQTAAIDPQRIFGVGVAITGFFVGRGQINSPAGMGSWALTDLETELTAAFNLPVWVENDGTAAAAGESLYGLGRRHRTFAYLYIGAGLGGGLVLEGQPWRGQHGNAGEFTGLLSGAERPNRPTLTLLLSLIRERGVEVSSISDLVQHFDPQWPGVETWLERTRPALTAITSAIGAVMDPEAIIVGGRIPSVLARMLAERAGFHAEPLRDHERPFPPVLAAEAAGDAAVLGAAAIPLQEHFF